MIHIIESAFWETVKYFGFLWPMMGVYGVIYTFFQESIEKWGFMHTFIQKALYYISAIAVSAAVGAVIGFMFGKSVYIGWRMFFMTAPAGIAAIYRLYEKQKATPN